MNHPKIIKTDILYNRFGKKFKVDSYQADAGEVFDWASLDTPSSSMVVTITPDNKLVIIRQYRFNLLDYTYEHPAGGAEIDEDHLLTANRELSEETGFESKEIILLGRYYVLPSETNRWVSIYLAKNAVKIKEPPLDSDVEKYFDMSVQILSFDEAESKMTGLEHIFALNLAKKYLKL